MLSFVIQSVQTKQLHPETHTKTAAIFYKFRKSIAGFFDRYCCCLVPVVIHFVLIILMKSTLTGFALPNHLPTCLSLIRRILLNGIQMQHEFYVLSSSPVLDDSKQPIKTKPQEFRTRVLALDIHPSQNQHNKLTTSLIPLQKLLAQSDTIYFPASEPCIPSSPAPCSSLLASPSCPN